MTSNDDRVTTEPNCVPEQSAQESSAIAAVAPTEAVPATAAKTKSGPTKGLRHLLAMPEFQRDLGEITECDARSQSDQIRIGELAHKWIGDRRYSRILNADRFADLLSQHTSMRRSGRQMRNYISAFLEHRLHRRCGKQFPNLEPSHLAKIRTCGIKTEADRLDLAQRVNHQGASVNQIKTLAMQLRTERLRSSRTLEIVPLTAWVRHMDGLDLLRQQEDASVECLVADWQWCEHVPWSQYIELPRPHHPDDPVAHLIACLQQASVKLSPHGLILLHYTACSFLDSRIVDAVAGLGFKHAAEFIWQKSCGGFQNQDSPLMIGHEKVILLCRRRYSPKSCCGGVHSVSPKWAAPARANSGLQRVHPYQKPVQLYEQLIAIATVNGLVVDLYAGSGAAGVAAVRLGCPYVGSEMKTEYVEVANHRIAMAKGENEEVIEAINFLCEQAAPEEYGAISAALKNCRLGVVRNTLGGGS